MQFRALGRENVTRRMNSAGKLSFAKEVGGGGFWNVEVDMMDGLGKGLAVAGASEVAIVDGKDWGKNEKKGEIQKVLAVGPRYGSFCGERDPRRQSS